MTTPRRLLLVLLAVAGAGACAGNHEAQRGPAPARTATKPKERGQVQRGHAAYYAARFQGKKTASGERFDVNKLTAAHKKLPFGTRVRVTNLKNGRSVVVRINDRGPYARRGGIIDVTPAAARALDMLKDGTVPVTVEVLSEPCPKGQRC